MSQQLPPQRPQVVYMQSAPNKGLAALLSLIIPGAGQMYRGHVIRGLLWLAIVTVGYCCMVVPGIALHLLCILFAAL